jgi:hypothetical protein
MNGYAVLFHKTCAHPCNTIRIHNALHYWRLLENDVFGIGTGGVGMRNKITPFTRSHGPANFSKRTDSTQYMRISKSGRKANCPENIVHKK